MRASAPEGKKAGPGEEGEEGWIELEALAVAKRRRDMPRLSEQHAEGAEEEEAAADDEMKVGVCVFGFWGLCGVERVYVDGSDRGLTLPHVVCMLCFMIHAYKTHSARGTAW